MYQIYNIYYKENLNNKCRQNAHRKLKIANPNLDKRSRWRTRMYGTYSFSAEHKLDVWPLSFRVCLVKLQALFTYTYLQVELI